MAYWLLKTEPSTYSYDDLARDQRTVWDGITNPAALKHLRSAAVGNRVLIYHTGNDKSAVGIAEVVKAPRPDPKDAALAVLDVAAERRLATPVPLSVIKAEPLFTESPLVRQGRLSFVPLSDAQWKRLLALGA